MIQLDAEFLAMIRAEPLPMEVTMYKRRMVWIERDGTKTPIPQLRTSHLQHILLRSERSWKNENKAGAWRLSFMYNLLREYEYRIWLDTNPVIT